MGNLLQDIRYGIRSLIKTPGFTTLAVIVLALGIGANTAIFTVVNAVLLRPLPYRDSDQLVMLWETNPRFQIGVDTLPVTHGNFMDWREQNSVFEYVSALGTGQWNLTGAGEPERVSGASVSPSFFRLMGAEPKPGRAFLEDEEKPGAGKIVVISHSLWQRRFAAEPGVIGSTITLDGEGYVVIGVAPEGFQFPRANELPFFVGVGSQTDLWRPMTLGEDFVNKKRANHQLCVMARLKPGVTRERAQSEMTAIAERLEQSYPDSNQGIGVKVVSLNEQVVGNVRAALWVLMGAVAVVLLIACVNVANLLLARSSARQKEIAIRTALGANRSRIVRQLLTESLVLSITSAAVGTLLSLWGIKAMLSLGNAKLPRAYEVGVDLSVLGFTVVVALFTSVLFGLMPALQASKINLSESLKDGTRGLSGGRSNRVRGMLVISEVALSLVLLIGAGLMIKSLAGLLKVDPGFTPDNTLAMHIALLGSKYPTAIQQIAFFQDVSRRVENLPGVQSVGLISSAPLSGGIYAGGFSIEGRVATSETDDLMADRRMISPDYFNTMGIRLAKGIGFTDKDDRTSPGVVIVSESWARRFLPNEDPIGKRLKLGGRDSTRPWLSIVGIAGDVRDAAIDSEARPCVYMPYPQFPSSAMDLVVRSGSDPKSLVSAIRDEVWAVDKDQPVTDVKTMGQYVADSVSPRRFNAMLLAIFASLALVLASVGVYGVTAYSVSQRTREIGIRVALGAQPSQVIRLIVGRGMALVLAGVAIGLISAIWLTRVMTSLLYGVNATDPITFACVSGLFVAVTLVASYVPARRATKVDPMVALRCE
jgi:putative ABC transport system permease protein